MRRSDFSYELPSELIAQQPTEERSASRLLHLDRATESRKDRQFGDLPSLLKPGDLLVVNDTRVIKARLFGRKPTGGKIEVLVERVEGAHVALAQIRASKPPVPGMVLELAGGESCQVEDTDEQGFYRLRFATEVLRVLERVGHIALPPYIDRGDVELDSERYQTLFASKPGAVAAPTAGLHFDPPLLKQLAACGVEVATITLHVGAGTFQPMRVDRLDDHHMHPERIDVDQQTCEKIMATRSRGGRTIAVGTTVVRALESVAVDGDPRPGAKDTRLFIRPGYEFQVIDAMVTNFHLPESTLLVLVSAFAGRERILQSYQHAIRQRYRFFSYGDAMLIT